MFKKLLAGIRTSSSTSKSENSECPCSQFGCLYHHAKVMFDDNDGKSIEDLNEKMISLMENIWVASYSQILTACILDAVRACIEACKRTKVPDECLAQFYKLRLEGSSLPASLILHFVPALGDSEDDMRHALLQLIFDQIPITVDARDELFYACARTGSTSWFCSIDQASLHLKVPVKAFSAAETKYKDLRYRAMLIQILRIGDTLDGFQLLWNLPDTLQALHSNVPFLTRFTAVGHLWCIDIQATWQNHQNKIKISLSTLDPSEGTIEGNLTVSPHDQIVGLSSDQMSTRFPLCQMNYSTKADWLWRLSEEDNNAFYQHVNKNGRCSLKFDFVVDKTASDLSLLEE